MHSWIMHSARASTFWTLQSCAYGGVLPARAYHRAYQLEYINSTV